MSGTAKAKCLVAAVAISILLSAASYAQGIYIPVKPPHFPRRPFFTIKSQHADVTINDQAATTVIKQVFVNESRRDLEGTYIFPIPSGASVSAFSMWMNGKKVSGELLDADEARRIYIDIVRRMKDPGLLEYAGQGMFRARIYPIPARGRAKIEISYQELLKYDSGVVSYRFPFNLKRFSGKTIGEVSMAVNIKSGVPIKCIYSPSHRTDVSVSGKTGYCGYEGKNVLPDRDFLLYYTLSEKDMGLNLLTHKPYGKNGYFMLLLSPGRLERTGAVISKEIVFVIDVSGSMAGEKIEQAKEALKYCLRKLNRGDRFNIITFATGIEYFQEGPVPAAMKMIDLALDFVDTIDARGGTNIDEALRKALSAAESPGAPRMIIFLTDGAPTVGETDDDDILKNVKKRNSKDARIFSFGVGYDVNTYLLDNLSLGNGGMAEYIKPEESIELKVTSFFSKVSDPIMTDISLEFDRVRIRDLYPTELPDIFNGMQLVLFGRYRDSGPTAIHLRGRVGENDKTMMFESSFDETNRGNDFIPRLWATRKIAYLLTEVRLHGESNELVGEIINLAKEHGIITPYTSYLIHKHGPPTIRPLMSRAMLNDQHDIAGKGLKKRTGVEAFRMSRNVGRDRESSTLSSPTSDSVVYVGRKTFYLTGDGWIDEEYAEGSDVVDLEFMSEKYLELLGTNPEIGDYLSIGTNVTFVFQGKCYRVRE